MNIPEFIRTLELSDEHILKRGLLIKRKQLISGMMKEINCEERFRRGLVKKTAADREQDRGYHNYWRG